MFAPDRSKRNTAVFIIQGAADPGVLPEAVALFAAHGLIPSRWAGTIMRERRPFLTVEVDSMADDSGTWCQSIGMPKSSEAC